MGKTNEELALERARLDLEIEKLEIDRAREKREGRFFSRHMGSIVTLVVSSAAVGVSYLQFQSNALQQWQAAQAEGNRQAQELKLKILDFVSRNQELIFTEPDDKVNRIRDILLVTLPPDVTERLFARLQATAASSKDLQVWTEGRAQALALAPKDAPRVVEDPIVVDDGAGRVFLHYQDARDSALMEELIGALREAGYRVPAAQLVSQKTQGDIRYYHEDEVALAAKVQEVANGVLARQGRPAVTQQIPLFKIGGPFRNLPRGTVEVWIPARRRNGEVDPRVVPRESRSARAG